MNIDDIQYFTPHKDINEILVMLSQGLQENLKDKLIGVYLIGSLTYGDFNRGSSDIDFLIVLIEKLSKEERKKAKNIHALIATNYPFWAKRIEASYITEDMLKSTEPPKTPRPYVNEGQMRDPDSLYGNEWLINLHVLYECGIALIGPDPKTLIRRPIDIGTLRRASKQDLYQEWKPLLEDPSALKDSHFQAYVVLTLCRILYRAKKKGVASKKIASTWVKKTYGEDWRAVVEKAENWQHGQKMDITEGILKFLKFVLNNVN